MQLSWDLGAAHKAREECIHARDFGTVAAPQWTSDAAYLEQVVALLNREATPLLQLRAGLYP